MRVSASLTCLAPLLLSGFVQCTGIHWLVYKGALLCVFLQAWCYICRCELSSFLGCIWWVAVGQPWSILTPSQCLVEWLRTMGILGWVSDHLYPWGRSIAWSSVVQFAFLDWYSCGCAHFYWVFCQHCILAEYVGVTWWVVSTVGHMILEWNFLWHLNPGALWLHLIYVWGEWRHVAALTFVWRDRCLQHRFSFSRPIEIVGCRTLLEQCTSNWSFLLFHQA